MDKIKIIPPTPTKRRQEIFDAYTPQEVLSGLYGYLGGEVAVTDDRTLLAGFLPPKRKKKKKKAAPKPPLKQKKKPKPPKPLVPGMEDLVQSVALVGHLIIATHCQNQNPHPRWIQVWTASLRVADEMEAYGVLPPCTRVKIQMGNHGFYCRRYKAGSKGTFLMPEWPRNTGQYIVFETRKKKPFYWKLDRKFVSRLILRVAQELR